MYSLRMYEKITFIKSDTYFYQSCIHYENATVILVICTRKMTCD